jgi:hypothetical protein
MQSEIIANCYQLLLTLIVIAFSFSLMAVYAILIDRFRVGPKLVSYLIIIFVTAIILAKYYSVLVKKATPPGYLLSPALVGLSVQTEKETQRSFGA